MSTSDCQFQGKNPFCFSKKFPFIRGKTTVKVVTIFTAIVYAIAVLIYYIMYKTGTLPPRLSGAWWEGVISYSFLTSLLCIDVLIFHDNNKVGIFIRGLLWNFAPILVAVFVIIFGVMPWWNPSLIWGAILGHLLHVVAILYLLFEKKWVTWKHIAISWIFWSIETFILYYVVPNYPMLWLLTVWWQTWLALTISSLIMGIIFYQKEKNGTLGI